MDVEIINTGSELLTGRTFNSHAQWLCQQFHQLGWTVAHQSTIPDEPQAIKAAVLQALGRSQLIITTGGLGPTSDDLTRQFIADLFEQPLRTNQEVRQDIENFFLNRKRPLSERLFVQAMVPQGATVLRNLFGTAPGLALKAPPSLSSSAHLVMLPGPPRELRPMFTDQVIPWMRGLFSLPDLAVASFKTTGLGESIIEEKLEKDLAPFLAQGLRIGYCARVGEVEVRLEVNGAERGPLLQAARQVVLHKLRDVIFSDRATMEETVVQLLRDRRATLSVAESCTGGLLSHRLTNVPGASEIFLGGSIAYANAVKEQALGVAPEMLLAHGAVSESVACAMADGIRRATRSTYALALTGIAGPTGGSPEKPVGTLFIGFSSTRGTYAKEFLNQYERETFKALSTQQALDLLRREMLATPAS